MTTIDNLMDLADEYAGRSQLTEAGEALSREALRNALTEAISKDASITNEGTKPQTDMPFVPWEKEDAEGLLQDVAAYIGVGGYNGATPQQLSERICAEFERLNNKAKTAQPVQEPSCETCKHYTVASQDSFEETCFVCSHYYDSKYEVRT